MTERVAKHMERPFYAFVHFGVNTFTDKEWGDGKESPQIFNPSALDADGMAKELKAAGMTGLVLTAKHHDGFCLWPTETTAHSVKNSPYKGGKGDVVMEFKHACEKNGLLFGVYLSPWDRNSPFYGTEAYNAFYLRQLKELLCNYGKLFYVWFDGACEDTRKQSYDFARYFDMVRAYQPEACIFYDGGPDIGWIGNEEAACSDEILLRDGFRPFEADVSIRRGWFYHEMEAPKSAEELFSLYLGSVGKGCCLHLNVPPTKEGRFDARDVRELARLGEMLKNAFSKEKVRFHVVFDANGRAKIDFERQISVKYIVLKENLQQGQSLRALHIEAGKNSFFIPSVGYQRIIAIEDEFTEIHLHNDLTKGKNAPVEVLLY